MSPVILLLALANTAEAPVLPSNVAAKVEARASVRIVRGARISWDAGERPQNARLTLSSFKVVEGERQPARFIEFE